MRFIHTSDWHLGQYFYGKSRAQEHKKFLHWLLAQVEQHQVDCIIVAGDIFDTGTPPSYARELYFDFIVNLNKLNCHLVVLAGNHDSVAMLSESKQLAAKLNTSVVTRVTTDITQQVFTIVNHSGEAIAVCCAVPYLRPKDIVSSSAGQSSEQKQQALHQAISAHYQALYQQAKQMAKDELPIVATGHLTTVGAKVSDSVRDIYIGSLSAFSASEFPEFDYIALGHIHKSQKVGGNEHIRYCGSPIPLSFDEAKQDKSVQLVEVEANQPAQVSAITIPCFQPLVMLKTSIEHLTEDLEKVKTEYAQQESVWLDIEIETSAYLQDFQSKIEELTKDSNIEVLLTRRSKQARKNLLQQNKKQTLNELSIDDVFDTRLEQEVFESEQEVEQKARLKSLFKQIHHDVVTGAENN